MSLDIYKRLGTCIGMNHWRITRNDILIVCSLKESRSDAIDALSKYLGRELSQKEIELFEKE